MEKAEFLIERKRLENEFDRIKSDLKENKELYLQTNRIFKDGEKVAIVGMKGNKRFAFIHGVELSYFDDVVYIALKCKKDGTPSLVKDFIWSGEKIEKI